MPNRPYWSNICFVQPYNLHWFGPIYLNRYIIIYNYYILTNQDCAKELLGTTMFFPQLILPIFSVSISFRMRLLETNGLAWKGILYLSGKLSGTWDTMWLSYTTLKLIYIYIKIYRRIMGSLTNPPTCYCIPKVWKYQQENIWFCTLLLVNFTKLFIFYLLVTHRLGYLRNFQPPLFLPLGWCFYSKGLQDIYIYIYTLRIPCYHSPPIAFGGLWTW